MNVKGLNNMCVCIIIEATKTEIDIYKVKFLWEYVEVYIPALCTNIW